MPVTNFGSNRDQLTGLAISERERLINRQVLFSDPRRWRPRWFDGRFLAASDLQAEQNYFLVRQADLGRAGGSGVVDGLMVSEVADATTGTEKIRIEPGFGVTDTGEMAGISEPLLVDPADVPEMQRLDAAFGLQVIPNEPGRNRTGLYVLALRAVEWTDNPIGAYPTSLTGQRTVEDGTIVEGVAVSLIPYPETGNDESWMRRRGRVAREIFIEGRDHGYNSGCLPLAMVALRGNIIEWVDPFMVRRETGAERPSGMDFGFGARALREAHLLQYQRHVADAFDNSNDQPFTATAYFDALPPIGQFPARTVDAERLTHRFFPSGIEVELAFVPEDEIPALIEESLLMPPIDLTLGIDDLSGTGVIVLVPLSRANFNARRASLPNWDQTLPRLRPAFVQLKAKASPRELLISRLFKPVEAPPAPDPAEAAWRQFLRAALTEPLLWYVRRRHLPIPSNVAGTPVSATNIASANPRGLLDLLREDARLAEGFNRLRASDSPEVNALTRRLTETRIVENPALLRRLVTRAAGTEEQPVRTEDVVRALAPATDPQLGEGLRVIENEDATLARSLRTDRVAYTGVLPQVDRLVRDVPAENRAELNTALREAVRNRETLNESVADLRRRFVRPPQ